MELGESQGDLKAIDTIDYDQDGIEEVVYLEKTGDDYYIQILDNEVYLHP